MFDPAMVRELNLLTSNGKGQIEIIAAGVLLGNLAWGCILGFARWMLASGVERERGETIEKAVMRALEERDRTRA